MNRPSRARTLMAFKSVTRQPDDEGGLHEAMNAVALVWGALKMATGSESYVAEQLRSQVESTFETARRTDIKADMRATGRDSREWEVLAVVADDEHPRFMRVLLRQYREKTAETDTQGPA